MSMRQRASAIAELESGLGIEPNAFELHYHLGLLYGLQLPAMLGGELTRGEALAAGRIATRQYAKRQYTWFSRQPPTDWPRFSRCRSTASATAGRG